MVAIFKRLKRLEPLTVDILRQITCVSCTHITHTQMNIYFTIPK